MRDEIVEAGTGIQPGVSYKVKRRFDNPEVLSKTCRLGHVELIAGLDHKTCSAQRAARLILPVSCLGRFACELFREMGSVMLFTLRSSLRGGGAGRRDAPTDAFSS